ncbi:MAG: DUF4381 domain-containing protein [Rhodocyclaceae bacterium]|nr:DUF4381 domain-containing protein [Rhodocyclaceae bacterium]
MSNPATVAAANAEQVAKALRQLQDIVEPAAPAFWPPAPAWYFVGAALLLLVMMAMVWLWRRWQANAYRRQALGELAALRDGAQSIAPPNERISALASLLRRVALHGAAREQVASLSGSAWIEYLSKQSKTSPSKAVATLLSRGPYAKFLATDEVATNQRGDLDAAFAFVAEWIKQHRVSGQHAA